MNDSDDRSRVAHQVSSDTGQRPDDGGLRPSPRELLGSAMLHAALPVALKRPDTGKAIVAIFTTPGAGWTDMLADAVHRRFLHWIFVHELKVTRDIAERRERADKDALEPLNQGLSVTAVSHDPETTLPPTLLAIADHRVEIQVPTGTMIASAFQNFAGVAGRLSLPRDIATGLTPNEILSVFRAGDTVAEMKTRLTRFKGARAVPRPETAPRLEDLGGYGQAKAWGLSLVRDLKAFQQGVLPWKELSSSALLHGPPGTGKTLFAAALARSGEVPLLTTSLGALFASSSGYLDGIVKELSNVFSEARGKAPCVLFIDELDALPNRATMSERHREWWTTVVTHLLLLLDSARERVIVIGATNHPDRLDCALTRPGRLAPHFAIRPPDPVALAEIVRHHLGSQLPNLDLPSVVRLAHGATGADAASWVKQARAYARAAGRGLKADDLRQQILPPESRRNEDLHCIAIHEAGHAVAGLALGRTVEQVSIVGTRDGDGFTQVLGNTICQTRPQLEETVVIALAGRAAERVIRGQLTAGSERDLEAATTIVAATEASLGLGDALCHIVPSKEALQLVRFDPSFRAQVENQLRSLQDRAERLITTHRGAVERIADALMMRRVLSQDDVHDLLSGPDGSELRAALNARQD